MITPVLRISSKFLFPLLVLFAAGCETQPPGAVNIQAFGPAKTNEEAWGPQATADKITQRFAGYTYTTEYLYMYFSEDGRVRGLAKDKDFFVVGEWRTVNSSNGDLLATDLTAHRVINRQHSISDEESTFYRVYIKSNKNIAVDLIVDGRFKGDTGQFLKPIRGFSHEGEFETVRKYVIAGRSPQTAKTNPEASKTNPAALVAEGIFLMVFCVGSALLLCPL